MGSDANVFEVHAAFSFVFRAFRMSEFQSACVCDFMFKKWQREVWVGSPSGPTGTLILESCEWTEIALLRPRVCIKKPLTTGDPKQWNIQVLTGHKTAYRTYTMGQMVWKVSDHFDGWKVRTPIADWLLVCSIDLKRGSFCSHITFLAHCSVNMDGESGVLGYEHCC